MIRWEVSVEFTLAYTAGFIAHYTYHFKVEAESARQAEDFVEMYLIPDKWDNLSIALNLDLDRCNHEIICVNMLDD